MMLLAVQSLKGVENKFSLVRLKIRREPSMCDVSLVHELDALIGSQSALIIPNPETKTYLTDLVEEGHKLSECLEARVIEGT
jgi:hypothetical protein